MSKPQPKPAFKPAGSLSSLSRTAPQQPQPAAASSGHVRAPVTSKTDGVSQTAAKNSDTGGAASVQAQHKATGGTAALAGRQAAGIRYGARPTAPDVDRCALLFTLWFTGSGHVQSLLLCLQYNPCYRCMQLQNHLLSDKLELQMSIDVQSLQQMHASPEPSLV